MAMSPAAQITCSFCLTFGVPAVLAIREIWTLRRRGSGGWSPDPEPEPKPSPTPPGRALPDCLIPKPWGKLPDDWGPERWGNAPERERELEPV